MSDVLQVIDPLESTEYLKCMDYLLHRELGLVERGKNHVYNMTEYAGYLGISRTTAYEWLHKWRDSGLLRACRERMTVPLGEEVAIAKRRILLAFPDIMAEAQRIALHGEKDKDRLEAIIFLTKDIVEVQMAETPQAGSDEANYIVSRESQPTAFSPLALLEEPIIPQPEPVPQSGPA